MDALQVGENYSMEDIANRRNIDTNKYIFKWNQDICWNEDAELDKYYKNNNETKFMELFNSRYRYEYDKVVEICEMCSSGGGWPNVEIQTLDFMTIDEFMTTYEKYYDIFDISIYIFDVDIVKIETHN